MQRSRLSRLPEPRRAAGHAALAGVLAVLSAGCSGKGGGHEPAAPVRVVAARESAVPAEIAAIGTVTPIKSIPVKARVDGQILEIAVREGGVAGRATRLGKAGKAAALHRGGSSACPG